MKAAIITFVFVLIATSQVWAGSPNDVNICHWQDYNGYWKLITVNAKAVDAHLTIHDDALPGEVTTFTGIELDENCAEVASLPSCGNCYINSNPIEGRTGCEITECADLVGSFDPYCLGDNNGYWDSTCVGEAMSSCQDVVCTDF